MKADKNNLFSRYKKDAGACKDGYFGYELWLEKKLIEAEAELKKLRLGGVMSQRELLLDFAEYSKNDKTSTALDECVDNYLDSIKQ